MQRKLFNILAGMAAFFVLGALAACSGQNVPNISNPNKKIDVQIVHPSATHLCVDGCKDHQNWIEFYLPSNDFVDQSVRFKTSIWLAQILTAGVSPSSCDQQDKPGYTCVDMEIRHTLLWGLTTLNLTPLEQLRNTNNWWLEYISSHS